jgi:hypothetical protein
METRETILQELKDISPAVANLGTVNVFSVPAGYFDQLPAAILSKINAETVDFRGRSAPFSVPAGYFDHLAGNILDKIKVAEQSVEAELAGIAPLLNTISKKQVYTVPEGYFESLELTIPLKLDKPSARVFSFGKTKRVMQYAVAACTAGILVIGAWFYTNKNTGTDETSVSYIDVKRMNIASELDKLSETEIASYLETTPNVGYAMNISAEEIDFDEYLDAASDEEINEYLNDTAEPSEKAGNGI